MVSCPICNSTDFIVGKCCKLHGQTVCIDCCKKCKYYTFDDIYFMHRCSYGVKAAEKAKNEIAETNKKIEELDKKQEDLFRRGYQQKADDVVWEIVELQRRLERLKGA